MRALALALAAVVLAGCEIRIPTDAEIERICDEQLAACRERCSGHGDEARAAYVESLGLGIIDGLDAEGMR